MVRFADLLEARFGTKGRAITWAFDVALMATFIWMSWTIRESILSYEATCVVPFAYSNGTVAHNITGNVTSATCGCNYTYGGG